MIRLITFGRYRGGADDDRLSEGALRLLILIGAAYLCYLLRVEAVAGRG